MVTDRFFRPAALSLAIALTTFAAPHMVQARDFSAETSATAAAQRIRISNFKKINKGLYRGGKPSDRGLRDLKNAGVKTIINLRMDGDGEDAESLKVKRLGMNYHNIEFAFGRPDLEKVEQVLDIMTDAKQQPVFIHCRQGADRTGMMVGIYRILTEGWSWDQVWDEMKNHHFKPFLFAMKNTVKQFYNRELTYDRTKGVQEVRSPVAARVPQGL